MAVAAEKKRVALVDLTALRFENTLVESLPADPVLVNVPRQVANACYTRVAPTPVAAPRLLAWSDRLGEFLGLALPGAEPVQEPGGNPFLPGMQPYAARYGGHQFGHWAGQLGDGRAITLAEMLASDCSPHEPPAERARQAPCSRSGR